MNTIVKRCWNTEKPLYNKYHDEEWGVPLHDDKKLFEFLILDGFQAGLSWWLILERRNALREAFDNFDPEKVAKYSSDDFSRLMNAPGVIRNKAKIFSLWDWSATGGKGKLEILRACRTLEEITIPAEFPSPVSQEAGFLTISSNIVVLFFYSAWF